MNQQADLSPGQREIMEIVWDLGEASVSEVRGVLYERREVARNTVRTLLERMEEKGWLKHRVDGRTYRYCATVEREASAGAKVLQVMDTVCGGSPEALVSALLDHRGLSDEEIARIRKMLTTATRQRRTKKGENDE